CAAAYHLAHVRYRSPLLTTDQLPGAPSKYRVTARKLSGAALTSRPALSGCMWRASTAGAAAAKLARRSRAQLRRLWRRRAATAVRRPERENGDHGAEQAAVHVAPRSTTYTLRCAVGTMITSRMFTCSGRFTM